MNPKNSIKVLAIIQARVASTRLPGKILMELDGKPLIQHTIEGVKASKKVDAIVVATSTNKENDPLEQLCRKLGIFCFRGSEEDVLGRFVKAAKTFNPKIIVRICGDEPFVISDLLDEAIKHHIKKSSDLTRTVGAVPKGLDIDVINYSVLKRINVKAKRKYYREHVITYVLDNSQKFKIYVPSFSKELARQDIILTVDTLNDYEFIKKIYFALKNENKLNENIATEIIKLIDGGEVRRKPKILLRADGSTKKGMGDIISLINIAENLTDYECIFASKDYPEAIDFIKSKQFEVIPLSSNWKKHTEIKFILKECIERNIKYCLIELNPNDPNYIKQLSDKLTTVMVDFDGNIPVHSDILLYWDIFEDKLKYSFKNRDTLKLIGSKYIPLKSGLQKLIKEKNSLLLRKITLSFGGSDPFNLTLNIAKFIVPLHLKYDFTIIAGPGYKYAIALKKCIKKTSIKLLHYPRNIHKIFSESDLVISAGGLTSFELVSLGVPFIGLSKLPWEIKRLNKLQTLGVCERVKVDSNLKKNLLNCINKLSTVEPRKKMSSAGKKLIDCNGAVRIAKSIRTRWKYD